VNEQFVPEHLTLAVADTKGGPTPGSVVNPGPLYQLPVFALFPYMLSGVALGIAEGLIDDYKPGAGRMTGARVGEIQSTQIRLGEATAYARASRLVQLSNCEEAERLIAAGRVPEGKVKARYRLEGAYAVDWAVRAVDVMFGLYGATGLYESGHVPRAFRDAHAVKQHFSFNTDIAGTTYGRVALGLPSDNPTL
jgi:3-hydroxy-9,10-secoandrosta-1,3,5(10)-triene-9,17-dione monooxygenase